MWGWDEYIGKQLAWIIFSKSYKVYTKSSLHSRDENTVI